jgi:hypothetical protein
MTIGYMRGDRPSTTRRPLSTMSQRIDRPALGSPNLRRGWHSAGRRHLMPRQPAAVYGPPMRFSRNGRNISASMLPLHQPDDAFTHS